MKQSFNIWNTVYLLLSGALLLYVVSRIGKKKETKEQKADLNTTLPKGAGFTITDFAKIESWFRSVEDVKLMPYPDGDKVAIGYGHQILDGEEYLLKGITQGEALELLRRDLLQVNQVIDRVVKIRLNQDQRLALMSFAYNIGLGAFEKSTLVKKLNQGDFSGAALEFDKWNLVTLKDGSKAISTALKNRRQREKNLFLGSTSTSITQTNTLKPAFKFPTIGTGK